MANDVPQFNETQPVLNPVQVESHAEGFDAFAKTLGAIAQSTSQKMEEVVSDQSNASLMTSASQMQTAKVNSQIEMLKHPDQAERIANNTADTMQSITKNSFVNAQDRRKLQSLGNDNFNEIRLKAAETSYQQSKRSSEIMYWDNYNAINQGIHNALIAGDMNKVKILENSLHEASANAVKLDIISAEQYANVTKANYDLYNKTEYLMKMAANPNGHTAAEFHSVMQSPFSESNADNVSYPVNTATQHIASDYNFDRSMAGQYAALYSGKPINYGVVALSKDHEYFDFTQQMMGVNTVKGAIQSGKSFAQIQARQDYLNAQPKLSPSETGEVNYWKSFKNQLQRGDGYLSLMTQTTLGGRYTQEYNQKAVAIRDSSKTQDEKFEATRENDNNYITNMANVGIAQKFDHDMIRPIPSQYVNDVQGGFVKDAPVSQAIARIAYLKPELRAYLADAMKKPNEAVAVYLAGSTLNEADTTFQAQLLEANQNRDYSSLLKTGKNETKNANIWDDIANDSNMKSLYTYLGKLPGGNETQNGLRDAATNYVLYRAAKEGDVNLNGKAKYESDFINNVSKGFNIIDGTRYLFNGSQLNLRKPDMDYIADYALSEAYRNIHQGRSEAEFQSYVDLNPLHVTNTPDGRIVVIDKAGHAAFYNQAIKDKDGKVTGYRTESAFDHPFTSDMLSFAHKNAEQTQNYMSKYFGFTENMERKGRLHPGFPFVVSKEDQAASEKELQGVIQKGVSNVKNLFSSSSENEGE